MDTIWKYELRLVSLQTIMVPEGGKILDVKEQDGKLMVWVRVNTDNEKVGRSFCVFSTGDLIPRIEYLYYISSIIDSTTGEVWHVYEKMRDVVEPYNLIEVKYKG